MQSYFTFHTQLNISPIFWSFRQIKRALRVTKANKIVKGLVNELSTENFF